MNEVEAAVLSEVCAIRREIQRIFLGAVPNGSEYDRGVWDAKEDVESLIKERVERWKPKTK